MIVYMSKFKVRYYKQKDSECELQVLVKLFHNICFKIEEVADQLAATGK